VKFLGLRLLSASLRIAGMFVALSTLGIVILPVVGLERYSPFPIATALYCTVAPLFLFAGGINALWLFGLASFFDAVREAATDLRAIRYHLARRERSALDI
jgi:hypothetical protein